jgi:hypothetical protein
LRDPDVVVEGMKAEGMNADCGARCQFVRMARAPLREKVALSATIQLPAESVTTAHASLPTPWLPTASSCSPATAIPSLRALWLIGKFHRYLPDFDVAAWPVSANIAMPLYQVNYGQPACSIHAPSISYANFFEQRAREDCGYQFDLHACTNCSQAWN